MSAGCCDCVTNFFAAPFRVRSYAILLYLFLAPFIGAVGIGLVPALLFPGLATVVVCGLGLLFLFLLWYALRILSWMDVVLGNCLLADCELEPRLSNDDGTHGLLHRVLSWAHAGAILYFGLLKSIVSAFSAGIAFGLLALSLGMMSHEGLVLLDKNLFETQFDLEIHKLTPGLDVNGLLDFIKTPIGRSVEAGVGLVLLFISFQVVVALGALNRCLLGLIGSQECHSKHDVVMKHVDDGGFGYTAFGRGSDYYSRGSLNSSLASHPEVMVRGGGRGVAAVGASYAPSDNLYSSILSNKSTNDSAATDYYRSTDRRGYR